MDYLQQINHRKELLQKAAAGNRLLPEERKWLATHLIYNQMRGYPFLNLSIEPLGSDCVYSLDIEIESANHPDRIIPVLSVPAGEGQICADFELRDYRGNISRGKPVKMLGLEWEMPGQAFSVDYHSKLGLLAIAYECDYQEPSQRLRTRRLSSNEHDLAMTREAINSHRARYYCKSPLTESYDALVFTITWAEK